MTRTTGAIFLSAGVPDPLSRADYARTADPVAIIAAVSALVNVVLGRRSLVWGGHPAITPIVWAIAEALDVDYGSWVGLYQSLYFQDDFPEDNAHFRNVTFTRSIEAGLESSLRHMRERMFSEHRFSAAVFIGGMGGVVEEFGLFRELQPEAAVIPMASTGGAALRLAAQERVLGSDLEEDFDYVRLLHKHLEIPERELRYRRPEGQPSRPEDRLSQRPSRDERFRP